MQAKTFYYLPLLLLSAMASASPANKPSDVTVKVFTSESYPKVFPHSGDWATHSDSFSNTENYSWALWRPYSCCKKQGQVFLGHVDWKSTHTH
ncbi:TPA: conjugal transfer protein [Mannheimia haemolytica]|uniref:Conjugal transfer protein n=1 Tax=Mannheimia haemolytica TaxID=75985 RepID=A0A249A0R3_MANHA|nr:hypothetical protein [Mannheimia haemolytica]AWW71875.1 conjugal transfer protein [Pasteurellaceae bacterium 12565]EPZ27493.1 hypothetical protein L280_13315 [Mannheimia haemolytica MhBrain2012]AGK01959.1 putative integrating conjugative element protein [Mannheimia haemolytica M42548]AGQ26738.1 hypothetical protein F382_12575 [Mannheimia haemolytica D153]AGQ42273.1 hypothetical protein J451_12645 [Mannheimia haemolytica D174]